MYSGLFLKPYEKDGKFHYIYFNFKKIESIIIDDVYHAFYVFCKTSHVERFKAILKGLFDKNPIKTNKIDVKILHVENVVCTTTCTMLHFFNDYQLSDFLLKCDVFIFKLDQSLLNQLFNTFREIQYSFPNFYMYKPTMVEAKFLLCKVFEYNTFTEYSLGEFIKVEKIQLKYPDQSCIDKIFQPIGLYIYNSHIKGHGFNMTLNVDKKSALNIIKGFPIIYINPLFKHNTLKFHPDNALIALNITIKTTDLFFIHFIVTNLQFKINLPASSNSLVFEFKNERQMLKAFHELYIMEKFFKYLKTSCHFLIGDEKNSNLIAITERFIVNDLRKEIIEFLYIENEVFSFSPQTIPISISIEPTLLKDVYILTFLEDLIKSTTDVITIDTCQESRKFSKLDIKITKLSFYENYKNNIKLFTPLGIIKWFESSGTSVIKSFEQKKMIDNLYENSEKNQVSIFSTKAPDHIIFENFLFYNYLRRGIFLLPSELPRTVLYNNVLIDTNILIDSINFNKSFDNVFISNMNQYKFDAFEDSILQTFNLSYNTVCIVPHKQIDIITKNDDFKNSFYIFKFKDLNILILKQKNVKGVLSKCGERIGLRVLNNLNNKQFLYKSKILHFVFKLLMHHIMSFSCRFKPNLNFFDINESIDSPYYSTNWFLKTKCDINIINKFFDTNFEENSIKIKLGKFISFCCVIDNQFVENFQNKSIQSDVSNGLVDLVNYPKLSKTDYKFLMLYYHSQNKKKHCIGVNYHDELVSFAQSFQSFSQILTCTFPTHASFQQKELLKTLYAKVL